MLFRSGRKLIHDKLIGYNHLIQHCLYNKQPSQTSEFHDNSISLLAGQQGKCYVTKRILEIGNMECHHKVPRKHGGTDEYKNLVWLMKPIHKLIHSTEKDTIEKYIGLLHLNEDELKRVNSLRKQVGNSII